MMKVPDISKYAILEKNSSLKVISKIISISDSSIYCFQRLSKFSSHVYFASSFATSPYQALKFKLYFRLIYLWHSRPSLCLQNQETVYQHIFSKIPKVTIWRKQQKHWRAKKDCWRMSGIGWTATPWFVILLITYMLQLSFYINTKNQSVFPIFNKMWVLWVLHSLLENIQRNKNTLTDNDICKLKS